jgi:general secretion pathway protein J
LTSKPPSSSHPAQYGFTPPWRTAEQGFTLVELLVSLVIFGMLAAAGVALLSFSVRAQDAADERLGALAEVRRAGALLTNDLAQAAPRTSRDEAGTVRRAFEGGGEGDTRLLSLVRRGWENLDGSNRSSLQKVEYSLADGALVRRTYMFVDGAAPAEPVAILGGIEQLRLRYRDRRGEWRDRWDPQRPAELPVAVEMVAYIDKSGPVRQLFLVGTGS